MSLGLGNWARSAARASFSLPAKLESAASSPLGDQRADIHIVQLAPEITPLGLDRDTNLLVDVVLLEPNADTRLRIALGKICGLEDDTEQRKPNAVAGAGAQRARRRMKPGGALTQCGDFLEHVLHIGRQSGQAPRTRAVFREGVIGPQETQHLREVRLTAAEEAADPGRRLLWLALVTHVGIEDANETPLVLALAHEVLQLEAQRTALVVREGVGHRRDAVVQQGGLAGVPLVDIPVFHPSYTPRSSCKVIGTAR